MQDLYAVLMIGQDIIQCLIGFRRFVGCRAAELDALPVNISPHLIEVYQALGGAPSDLAAGTVDGFIIGQPSLEATIPEFKILSLPYLFDSEAEALKALRGSFGQKLMDLLPKHNMIGLGWAGVFTRGIPATRAVETASDLYTALFRRS